MKKPSTNNFRAVKRIIYLMVATLMAVAGWPLLNNGNAAAATQLSRRSIQLSDSSPSGAIAGSSPGSGTGVTYKASFITGAATADSFVIDFCSNDPIIGDVCNYPTGIVLTTAVLNAAAPAGNVDTAHNWSVTGTSDGTVANLKFKDTVSASNPMATATNEIINVTGISNPSTTGSYYARIYTYSNNAWTGYAAGSGSPRTPTVGSDLDYGGIALSTATPIQITARVQETLIFCVSGASPNTWNGAGTADQCSDPAVTATGPQITIGHGSPTQVIDNSEVDTANVYSSLSTNATNGAVVNIRNNNTCGGLSANGGTSCSIPPIGGGTVASPTCTTPYTGAPNPGACAMTPGVAAFGLNVEPFTATTAPASQSGTVTPTSFYYNASHNTDGGLVNPDLWYGMDNLTPANTANTSPLNSFNGNVGTDESASPYGFGSTVGVTTAPCYLADNAYIFAATAALTTPAGIYQANMSLIATGTF